MKADPEDQLRLLDLQAVDTVMAQRTYRRRTLPELAIIAESATRLATLSGDVVRAQTEIGDLSREQRRLELDVDQVRSRSERDQQRLESGSVGSPKELERLQHEVQSLARRQGDLEDQVLELMERREALDAALAAVNESVQRVTADRDDATARRDSAFAEIDAELSDREAERDGLTAALPADLLALYERLRAGSGGTGAAALRQRRCEGCRMELASTDLNRARNAPPDEVLRCEECGRILVRTPESGL
ncbi:MAG: zinc ribbon domain-containing protein [Geodermatophilaceae bacterium]